MAGPDYLLLSCMQFQFVKHARINDLHQALKNNYGDTVADTQDIDQSFTTGRADIKSDAELLRAVRGKPVIDGRALKVSLSKKDAQVFGAVRPWDAHCRIRCSMNVSLNHQATQCSGVGTTGS